jgi:hypothetical protein
MLVRKLCAGLLRLKNAGVVAVLVAVSVKLKLVKLNNWFVSEKIVSVPRPVRND